MSDEPKKYDPISDAMGLNPLISYVASSPSSSSENATVNNDFDYARQNLYSIIEKAQQALEELLPIAIQGQQPRAFEVISGLVKTIADTNKDLMQLHKQKADLGGPVNVGNDDKKVVNNNLFVGSTAELQKMMENIKKNG